MKLATFRMPDRQTRAGAVRDESVFLLDYPTVLEMLRDPEGLIKAQRQLDNASKKQQANEIPVVPMMPEAPLGLMRPVYAEYVDEHTLHELVLLSPIPEPPSVRDFYAFEQHVKAARAKRGVGMIPEWYEIPTFYFTNNSEIYGHDQEIPYPVGSNELDIELEIACVIGREGKDIPVEEAASYIAGYTIMNDWSARDFQRKDMKLNLGPGKGKDFATSLGPWIVTPDELESRRIHSSSGLATPGEADPANVRYDMTMLARVNGKEISRGNFKDIYYSFPQMIAYASRNARLRVGDVIGSGTVGTGCLLEIGTEVHPWFQRGDVIELEIEGIGVLRNRIV
ncbi:MAG TPA: fumarylacetoacetate hydrolase family protein [Ktedonobacteraceae bacterium]|nr:fumarylacetoacetate hydrolase family protein [Ktedonobacteraceae bacterium]